MIQVVLYRLCKVQGPCFDLSNFSWNTSDSASLQLLHKVSVAVASLFWINRRDITLYMNEKVCVCSYPSLHKLDQRIWDHCCVSGLGSLYMNEKVCVCSYPSLHKLYQRIWDHCCVSVLGSFPFFSGEKICAVDFFHFDYLCSRYFNRFYMS